MKSDCSRASSLADMGRNLGVCLVVAALLPLLFMPAPVPNHPSSMVKRHVLERFPLPLAFIEPEAQDQASPPVVMPYEEGLPVVPHLKPLIQSAARRYDVDPALIKAVIMAESAYDTNAVSSQGAVGLMQLMPSTAASLGVQDAFDPGKNINGGVKYLKQLLERFQGDVKMALAAYNAGLAIVLRYQGIPPIKAVEAYLGKVLGYYQYYKQRHADQEVEADREERGKA